METKKTGGSAYMAIGIFVLGLLSVFQGINTFNTYIDRRGGADIKRQIEPTQTSDITKIQTDISAIKTTVDEINRRLADIEKWKVEELRAISDLRARVTNLERKEGK